jgi:hypothetical protein
MDKKYDYYLYVSLTVLENNETKYANCKEFFIKDLKSYKNKTIQIGNYELINIIDDLEDLYIKCSSL